MNWLIAERLWERNYSGWGPEIWYSHDLDDAVMCWDFSPKQALDRAENYLKEHPDIKQISLLGFDAYGRKVSERVYELYDNEIREIPNE